MSSSRLLVFVVPNSHEYISGYYRVSVYFLSKILSDIITLRTIPAIVFSCVAYFMIGGLDAQHGNETFAFMKITFELSRWKESRGT